MWTISSQKSFTLIVYYSEGECFISRIVEIYKDIIINGMKTIYMISDDGNIINRRTKKQLKQRLNKRGYPEVRLQLPDGTKCTKRVHRLVAEAFIPNPENKYTVNHEDLNKTNNSVENLTWMTNIENHRHGVEHGAYVNIVKKGSSNNNANYTDDQIREVCTLLEDDILSQHDICRRTGVSVAVINRIRKNESAWSYIRKDFNIKSYDKLNHYDDELKMKIVELANTGYSYKEIINILNLPDIQSSYSLIGNTKQKYIYKCKE